MRGVITSFAVLLLTVSVSAETYPTLLDRRLIAILAPADGARACYGLATPEARVEYARGTSASSRSIVDIESMVYQLRIREVDRAPQHTGISSFS